MAAPLLLRGVDRAAFAVALVARLRAAGVMVPPGGPSTLVQALGLLDPTTPDQMYWTVRLTLVSRADDLPAFDQVFAAVFSDAVLGMDPPSLKSNLPQRVSEAESMEGADSGEAAGGGLPWSTRPAPMRAGAPADTERVVLDVLPSRLAARAEEPFDQFDAADLQLIGTWLERASATWPRRRSLRNTAGSRGRRIDLRRTLRASRSTGWEPLRLAVTRRRMRPRRVVLLCDVSRSMQPYVSVYLHLMRSAALHAVDLRPEVFACGTSLRRLTPVLAHRSADVALARANAAVVDRYGGTHLGAGLANLLAGVHGAALRGAVVVIASDGWDSDPPEVLEQAMARLSRRADTVVWLNPRAAAAGYVPLVKPMAAALPYCDLFLPANSLAGLRELVEVLSAYHRTA
ncbi:VWA containing CoxE family protein [Mycobacterium sp. MS1601]|uniref:vWA domain-containing protein n=1 Tax=Mycobacterium sp. MS1601 TaxID=1936029 RepID=UPI000979782F|nr:VWA domain-containing protein [Mycobacterium sp. MS1601]AQA03789.1 VWA containing CoxE family protein [Mycobacterium sp. MS1601]